MPRIPIEPYIVAQDRLVYDETSPSCLRWKATGKPAGGQDKDGYWLVRVNYRLLKAHRVIWFMHHGVVPDLLDHEDTHPSNNKLSNLREATESQNRHNSNKHKDNTSGMKGVYWDKKNQKWLVQIMANGKLHYVGRFDDKSIAEKEATTLRNKLHKGFARHA